MSEFDFEAALAAQVAASREETPAPEPVVDEQPAEEPEDLEDPEETPEADETPEAEEPEETPAEEPQGFSDPRITEFLARHNGDLEAALRQAIEAQSLIGRQGSELGELRKLVEQLQARMDTPSPVGNLDDLLEESPWEVIQHAIQTNDTRLHDRALEAWYELDPRQASRYEREIELAQLRMEMEQKIAPIQQPVQAQTRERLIAQATEELSGKYPDFKSIIDTVTESEMSGLPAGTLEVLQTGDLAGKRQALEVTYRWVKAGRVIGGEQTPAAPPAPKDTTAKRKATVASASAQPASGESSSYDRLKAFMLEPEPTSVSHGLTR